jgi:hypothetical protein
MSAVDTKWQTVSRRESQDVSLSKILIIKDKNYNNNTNSNETQKSTETNHVCFSTESYDYNYL